MGLKEVLMPGWKNVAISLVFYSILSSFALCGMTGQAHNGPLACSIQGYAFIALQAVPMAFLLISELPASAYVLLTLAGIFAASYLLACALVYLLAPVPARRTGFRMHLKNALSPTPGNLALALLLFIFFAPVFETVYACSALGCVPPYLSIFYVLISRAAAYQYYFALPSALSGAIACYAISCAAFLLARYFLAGKKAKKDKEQ